MASPSGTKKLIFKRSDGLKTSRANLNLATDLASTPASSTPTFEQKMCDEMDKLMDNLKKLRVARLASTAASGSSSSSVPSAFTPVPFPTLSPEKVPGTSIDKHLRTSMEAISSLRNRRIRALSYAAEQNNSKTDQRLFADSVVVEDIGKDLSPSTCADGLFSVNDTLYYSSPNMLENLSSKNAPHSFEMDYLNILLVSLRAFEEEHFRAANFEAAMNETITAFNDGRTAVTSEEDEPLVKPFMADLSRFRAATTERQVEAIKWLFELSIYALLDKPRAIEDPDMGASVIALIALLNSLKAPSKLRPPVSQALKQLFASNVNAIVDGVSHLLKLLFLEMDIKGILNRSFTEPLNTVADIYEKLPLYKALTFSSLSLLKRIFSKDYISDTDFGVLVKERALTSLIESFLPFWGLYLKASDYYVDIYYEVVDFGAQHFFWGLETEAIGDCAVFFGSTIFSYSSGSFSFGTQRPPGKKAAALGLTVNRTALVTAMLKQLNVLYADPLEVIDFLTYTWFDSDQASQSSGSSTSQPARPTWEKFVLELEKSSQADLAYLLLVFLWSRVDWLVPKTTEVAVEQSSSSISSGKVSDETQKTTAEHQSNSGGDCLVRFSTDELDKLLFQLYTIFEIFSNPSKEFLECTLTQQHSDTAKRMLCQLAVEHGAADQIWSHFAKVDAAIEASRAAGNYAVPAMVAHLSNVLGIKRPNSQAVVIGGGVVMEEDFISESTAVSAGKKLERPLSAASNSSAASSLSSLSDWSDDDDDIDGPSTSAPKKRTPTKRPGKKYSKTSTDQFPEKNDRFYAPPPPPTVGKAARKGENIGDDDLTTSTEASSYDSFSPSSSSSSSSSSQSIDIMELAEKYYSTRLPSDAKSTLPTVSVEAAQTDDLMMPVSPSSSEYSRAVSDITTSSAPPESVIVSVPDGTLVPVSVNQQILEELKKLKSKMAAHEQTIRSLLLKLDQKKDNVSN